MRRRKDFLSSFPHVLIISFPAPCFPGDPLAELLRAWVWGRERVPGHMSCLHCGPIIVQHQYCHSVSRQPILLAGIIHSCVVELSGELNFTGPSASMESSGFSFLVGSSPAISMNWRSTLFGKNTPHLY